MCWNMKVLLRVLFILATPSQSQLQFPHQHDARGQLQQGQHRHLGQEQHYLHGQDQPVITMVVNITQEDKLNIELADRVGVSHLAVSYPEGINCTLKKSRSTKAVTKCENITIPECKKVHKVKLNNVTEDCSRQREYCQYNFRTQELTKQNIICERDLTQICTGSCPATSCPTYCERNPIVVCSTEHQMVVVTEKRQRCGESKALVTTKICFTYPDASWTCRELRPTHDCERESVRAVANELGVPKISCVEKEQDPVCLPKNCRLASNDTHCLTTDLPVQVELEDFVCEECSQGRTKLRPVLVQVENCDHEVTQEFCVETEEHKDEWTKTCTVPNTMQPKVLRNVLLDQQEDEKNEINDKKGDERRKKIKQSKLVRLNLPMQWQNIKGTKDEDETEEQIKISDQITKNYKMELEREREDNSDKNVNEKQDKGLSFKPQTRENHVEEQVKVQINDQQSKTSNNMHLVRKDSDNIHERNHRNRNNEKQTEVEIQSQVGKKHVEHQNILRNVKIELGQEGREYEQKKLEDSTACEQHNKHESREHEQQDSRAHEQQTILPRPFINTFNHPRKLIQERKQQVEVGKRQNIKSDDANQNHKTLPVQRDKCRSQRGFSLLGLVSCLKKNNIRTTSRSSSNRNQATARISHKKNQSIHENSFDSNKTTFVTSQEKSRPTSGISYDKIQPTSKTTYAKKQPTSKTFPELTQSKPTSTSPRQSSVHSPRVGQQKLALSRGVQRSSYAQNSSNFEQHAQGKGSSSNIFQYSTSAELTTSKSIEIRRTVTQKNRVKHLVDGFVVSAPPKTNSHTLTAKSRGSTENVSPEISTLPSFAGTTLASSQKKVARKSIFNNHRNKNRNVFRVPILSAKSDLALNGKRKENVKTSEGKETKNIFGLRSRGSALQRNNNLLRSQTHSRQLSSEEVYVKNVDINNGGIKKMQSTKSKYTKNQAKTVVKLNNEGIKNYTLNRKPLNVEANEEAGQGTKPKKAIIRIKESSQPIHLNERPIKDITNPTKNKTNKGMQILKPDLVEQNEGQEEPSHMNHRKLVSNKSTCRFPFKCYGEIVLNSSMVSESLQSKQQNELEIKPIQKNIVNNLQREGTNESNLVTKTAGSEFKQSKNKHHFKLNSSTENPKITLDKGKLPLENRSIDAKITKKLNEDNKEVEQKMHLLDIELEDPSLSQNQTHISKYEERQVVDSQSENIMENKSSDSPSKTLELKLEDNQDIHIEESPRNFEHPDAVKNEHKIELIEKPNNIEKNKLASREEIEKLKVASREQKVPNKNQGVSNSIEDKVSRTPKVIETNTSKVIMDKNKPVETRVKCDDCNCIENIREKVTCKVIKCFKNSQLCFS